ncbi:hypothetical protein [Ferruginibacter albus]|uniref:hypothetical protein n=1 Tax=Ferruginibacter albus TaxID=2875540 RepID=UPI001CC783BB|nr:hypothetical protein [Ferruginibacter albus]UAY52572.1 hypothetical protein K9M53_02500 [Ferruginibacter albus]
MKYFLGIILLLHFTTPAKTPKELFNNFHSIYAAADFKAMDSLLADDFVLYERQIMTRKPAYISYLTGWNQVFQTKWNVESVSISKDTITSIEYDSDIFNDYFYGGKYLIRYTYLFKNNQLQSLVASSTDDGKKAEEIYAIRHALFYKWVATYHADKTKFFNAYDKQSAQEIKMLLENYLKIIQQ